MQNNDLIGKVVLSKAGRDINHLYVIVGSVDSNTVLLSNGSNKVIGKPKKKKLKHLEILYNIDEEILTAIINNDKSINLKIKRFFKLKMHC